MSKQMYNVALKNALTEIKSICSDVNWSLILMSNGALIAGDEQATDETLKRAADSFQTLAEKALAVGGLNGILIDAEKGKVYVSCINDVYLIAGLNKDADLPYFRSIAHTVLSTIIRVLDSVALPETQSTPLPQVPLAPDILSKPLSSEQQGRPVPPEAPETESEKKPSALTQQQLMVDSFGGLLVRSDSVQIDEEILKQWSELLGGKEINEVEIETLDGRTNRYKTKAISDSKFKGRKLIRIPEKTCQSLKIQKGDLVKVKPIVSRVKPVVSDEVPIYDLVQPYGGVTTWQ